MRMSELRGDATGSLCNHVLSKERPLRYFYFQNGFGGSCHEPDHGEWGRLNSEISFSDFKKQFPEAAGLDLVAGQEAILNDGNVWKVTEISERTGNARAKGGTFVTASFPVDE